MATVLLVLPARLFLPVTRHLPLLGENRFFATNIPSMSFQLKPRIGSRCAMTFSTKRS